MPNSRLIINSGDFKDVKVQDEMASRFMQYTASTGPGWR
jgi:hypothetical protein